MDDASQSRSDSTGKLRVLIVDDEKNIRTTLSLCLEQMDCYVKSVSSVDGALATLRYESFDVAFLDLRLGEANGLENWLMLCWTPAHAPSSGAPRIRPTAVRRVAPQAFGCEDRERDG